MSTTLQRARISQGLSLSEAAEKLQISKNTLSKYERGITFPGIKKIEEMEKLYQVSYNDIQFVF